ncbi:MAG: hypothetical protein VX185_05815 [Pseudomonadota bacterium]|nr:hypothetical protein [Pseudomonadota bacterium]
MVRINQAQSAQASDITQQVNNLNLNAKNPNALPLTSVNKSDRLSQVATTLLPELQKAKPEELATQGQLRQVKPGLLECHFADKNNNILYFGHEQMNKERAILWDHYSDASEDVSDGINYMISSHFNLDFDTDDLDSDLSPEDKAEVCFDKLPAQAITADLVSHLRLNPEKAEDTMRSLENISIGSSVFYAEPDVSEHARYAVYASSKPITDFALDHIVTQQKEDINLKNLRSYAEHTKHILMAVSCGASKNVGEQRGIFKGPLATLNKTKADFSDYRIRKGGLSAALTLVAMQSAKAVNLRYFTISPHDVMQTIILKNFQSEIKRGTVAWGEDDIAAKGWSTHIRDVGDREIPFVFDLKHMKNKLFHIKPATNAA